MSPDVLIVGGGPVGLLAAILLHRQGLTATVVERRHDVQAAPAAHVVNARTFEICRAAGIDAAALDAACSDPGDGAWVRWVTTLVGDELGAVPFERQGDLAALDAVTPTPLRNLSQHRLEPILRAHVAALDGVELRADTTWVGAHEAADAVESTVRCAGTETSLASTWLIGADGAASAVRRWCGIAMEGPTALASTISIHVEADLREHVHDRPATLYWTTAPGHEGVFVAHDLSSTWVFMHPWDPEVEDLADYAPLRCEEIFRAAAGGIDADLTVRSITPWTMTCQVAARYRAGRTFLVGDAAHRFPPTGGLGLNTGAADAFDLAWKLGAVHAGWAGPGLLDTYGLERRPVATANAEQSLTNALRLLQVTEALDRGTDAVTTAIAAQAEHFDMLGLQLGATYEGSPAVAADGTPPPRGDRVRDYVPSTRPGGRLPHAWVRHHGRRCSTLDLVPSGAVLLLTTSGACAEAARRLDGTVPVVVAEAGVDLDHGPWEAALELDRHAAVLVRPDQHVLWRGSDPRHLVDALEVLRSP